MARSRQQNDWIREALTAKDPETYDQADARQARDLWQSTKTLNDRLLMIKVKYRTRYNVDANEAKAKAAGTSTQQDG